MTSRLREATAPRVPSALGAVCIALLLAAGARAVDWNDLAGVQTVVITTTNEDGTPRKTTVWLVVLDRTPYVRTGSTRWGANAERSPDVALNAGGKDYLLRAVPVADEAVKESLRAGYREKYGWEDVAARMLPGAATKFFRLEPRPGS